MESLSPVRFNGVSFVTTSLGPNDPKVGDTTRTGNENYIFVYNVGSSTIGVSYGAVVSANSGYSVTVSSVSNVDILVGVCKHAAIATGSYGWLMTKGWCQIEMGDDNSAIAGGLLQLGLDGKFGNNLISTGNIGNAVGKIMSTVASAGSGTAFISVY